ncbi:acyl-[acyl-carrier-protein] thioesterase [Dictyobacter alpinus]|uniref:acyl-[acyl-carrier-protein] thioesterase n=1 Tax=Dictyobacter alpinus TaxID=2014873 RepID=UPI0013866912|nr:thioesterase family protein [Dictyobacter alpinus]
MTYNQGKAMNEEGITIHNMRRQYSHTYTARYDEGDCYGHLTPSAFLRYTQDIAALDAEDIQLPGDGYWIIKRTVISFAAPVQMHTRLEMQTYGMSFSRITAQRGYEARIASNGQDEPVITARSLWVYVDKRGRPTRLPAGTAEIWLPDGPLAAQPEPAFPVFPDNEPESAAVTVRFSDVDLMRHMNNAAYVEALDNAAWESYARVGLTPDNAVLNALQYDIEYLDSALLGEKLTIKTWLEKTPAPSEAFIRYQQILRGDVVLARAWSRWFWQEVDAHQD